MTERKFEDQMQRLERIVQNLEGDELSLEDALKHFEEGMNLVKFCSGKLEEAEDKVNLLVQKSGGKHIQVPFDLEGENHAE